MLHIYVNKLYNYGNGFPKINLIILKYSKHSYKKNENKFAQPNNCIYICATNRFRKLQNK